MVEKVAQAKVPLLQRSALLGFNGITIPIINRLPKLVPKEFLTVKPCTAVEKVSALIAWVMKDSVINDLAELLKGWFDRKLPTKPFIQSTAAFVDEILDPDGNKDLQTEHNKDRRAGYDFLYCV